MTKHLTDQQLIDLLTPMPSAEIDVLLDEADIDEWDRMIGILMSIAIELEAQK